MGAGGDRRAGEPVGPLELRHGVPRIGRGCEPLGDGPERVTVGHDHGAARRGRVGLGERRRDPHERGAEGEDRRRHDQHDPAAAGEPQPPLLRRGPVPDDRRAAPPDAAAGREEATGMRWAQVAPPRTAVRRTATGAYSIQSFSTVITAIPFHSVSLESNIGSNPG